MKLLNSLQNAIFSDNAEVTTEVIAYYRENPQDLDLIINKEYFHSTFLGIFFVIGIIITLSSRIIQYLYGNLLGDFVNTVILDVISELGIAIFGGAVVAYIIEFLKKRQYQKNIKFRNQIKKILDKGQDINMAENKI